jgi:hypothetical protein
VIFGTTTSCLLEMLVIGMVRWCGEDVGCRSTARVDGVELTTERSGSQQFPILECFKSKLTKGYSFGMCLEYL